MIYHVYPVNDLREHVTGDYFDGPGCWCNPRIVQPCPVCNDDEEAKQSCSYCDQAGWVAAYASPDDVPTLIVHNAADGRE